MAAVVLAASLAFAQAAYIKSRMAADIALRLRQAHETIGYAMGLPISAVGETNGQAFGFSWRLNLVETGQPGRVAVCRRTVRARDLAAPSRSFEASGLEPCPPKAAV